MSGAAFAAPAQVGDTKIKSAAQSFKTAVKAFRADYKERREVAGPGLFKRMAMKTGNAIRKVATSVKKTGKAVRESITRKLFAIHDTTVATVRVAKSAIHNEREKIAAERADRKAARAQHENGGIISLNLNDTARAKPAPVKAEATPVAEARPFAALSAPTEVKLLAAPKPVPSVEMNEQKALPAPREMKLLTAGTPETKQVATTQPKATKDRGTVIRRVNATTDFRAPGVVSGQASKPKASTGELSIERKRGAREYEFGM
jgi:hypothetical protein